jgi:hypothetical protein
MVNASEKKLTKQSIVFFVIISISMVLDLKRNYQDERQGNIFRGGN